MPLNMPQRLSETFCMLVEETLCIDWDLRMLLRLSTGDDNPFQLTLSETPSSSYTLRNRRPANFER